MICSEAVYYSLKGVALRFVFGMFFYPNSGRKLTSQGQRDMDRIAGQVNNCYCVMLYKAIT